MEYLSLTDAYAKTAAVFWGSPAHVWTFEGLGLTPTDWSDFPLSGPVYPRMEVKGNGSVSNQNGDPTFGPERLANAVRETQGTGLLRPQLVVTSGNPIPVSQKPS